MKFKKQADTRKKAKAAYLVTPFKVPIGETHLSDWTALRRTANRMFTTNCYVTQA